ncbi:MAG: peptide chain release factor 1 [Alphaproteobacteria bacterium]|jgi:peptide chain release factor 1|nr:peptide chain release factor 1 [Alphaproteobacteria bacterium]
MVSLSRLEPRLRAAADRFQQVEARMAAATDGAELVRLAREHAELKALADIVEGLSQARSDVASLEALLAETPAGDEMAALAEEELKTAQERLAAFEHQAQRALLPKREEDDASAILEVRAGTGGEEAALFAGDLVRMYQRFASLKGWRFEVEDANETGLGGYKQLTATITGPGAYGVLRYESGVHRVQRVPETEAGGRVHTSAATVAVLPEPEDVAIEIDDKDLRIDTMRASGAGGQHVNKTDSAVRITHLPTGIMVVSQEKSQHQNRARAMKILKAKLLEMEQDKAQAARAADRAAQIGSGDRSERIRTYNFPQGRVTDHRINLTLYNLDDILSGPGLAPIIEALMAEDEAARLLALQEEA